MILCEVPEDLAIADQGNEIASRQDQIKVIGPVAILDQLHLPLKVGHFRFHACDLLSRYPFETLRISRVDKLNLRSGGQ